MNQPSARIGPGTAVGPYLIEYGLSPTGATARHVARSEDGERVVVEVFDCHGSAGPVPPAQGKHPGASSARARLVREIRALTSVDSKHVARVRSSGERDGRLWIATEYVPGTDLGRLVAERGPQILELAVPYLMQATEGLAAAHAAGVVHRDLTPGKLRVTRDGTVVVVGFGIATHRPDMRDASDSSEPVADTPYVAPEQIEHDLADERSDVWGLGCVLYEVCAGEPPFGRSGPDMTAAILRDEPRWSDRVTGPVMHVISACLRKSSFARIGSARELLGLLRDLADVPHGLQLGAAAERVSSSRRASVRPSVRPSAPPAPAARPSSPPRMPSAPRVVPLATRLGSRPPSRPPSGPPSRPATFPPSMPASIPPVIPPSFAPSFPPSVPASLPPSALSGIPMPSRPPASLGRVKGTAIRAGLAWYATTYGAAVLGSVARLASPELQAALRLQEPDFGIMPSGWYDTAVIGELLGLLDRAAAAAAAAGAGAAASLDASLEEPDSLLSKIAQAIAQDNVTGVYRSLFRLVASPPMLEAHAQRVWRTYIDEGTLSVAISAPGSLEAQITGWSRHDAAVCRFLRPLIEHLLRAVGYTHMVVDRTRCVADGDPCCAFEGSWVVG